MLKIKEYLFIFAVMDWPWESFSISRNLLKAIKTTNQRINYDKMKNKISDFKNRKKFEVLSPIAH